MKSCICWGHSSPSPRITGRSYNSMSGLRDWRVLNSAPWEWTQSCYHGINPFVMIETLCTNPPLKGLLSQHCRLRGHSGQTWQLCSVLWSFSWLFGYVSTVASTLGLSLAVTIYSRPCPPALAPWEHFCSLIISWCWHGLDNLTVSWSPLECQLAVFKLSPSLQPSFLWGQYSLNITSSWLISSREESSLAAFHGVQLIQRNYSDVFKLEHRQTF